MADKAARKMSERMPAAEVAKYESTRYAGNQKLVDRIEQRMVRELLHRAAGARTDLRALDVPCGYGRFTSALLEVAGSLFDGDQSAGMATRARTRAKDLGRDAIATVVDIRSLPYGDGAFDVVLSMRLLHHLYHKEDRDRMFRELARVTREHVVISYYDRTILHRVQRKLSGLVNEKRRKATIFFFGTAGFTEEANAAGFDVVDVKAPLPFVHAQRLALLRRRR